MKKKQIFLPLIIMVCACTDWKGGSGNEQTELSWGQAAMCIENPIAPGEDLYYQIKFELDTLAGEDDLAKQLAAVIRDSILFAPGTSTIQEAMASYADSLETEWKAELAEMYDPESDFKETFQYYYTIEGSAVENGNDGILSYQTTTDCYLGGAHGSYVVCYYNFDKESGKRLNIRDIVPADKEQDMLKAMEKQLCDDWEAEDMEELREQTGITMLGDLYLTNNFLLKNDSIEFLFNQYEIAPYAAGLISVTIPSPTSR